MCARAQVSMPFSVRFTTMCDGDLSSVIIAFVSLVSYLFVLAAATSLTPMTYREMQQSKITKARDMLSHFSVTNGGSNYLDR